MAELEQRARNSLAAYQQQLVMTLLKIRNLDREHSLLLQEADRLEGAIAAIQGALQSDNAEVVADVASEQDE